MHLLSLCSERSFYTGENRNMSRLIWLYQAIGIPVLLLLNFQVNPSISSSSSSSSLSTSPKLCHHDQSISLLQFKNSLSIDGYSSKMSCYNFHINGYPKTDSWKEGKDCCLWDGVTCDKLTGHVIGLDLSSSWLLGSIYPNSSLFLLKHLQSLNLAFNNFGGSLISPKIGQLTSLTYLNLSCSLFSGEIPSEIAQLSSLVLLDLSDNHGMTFSQHDFGKLSQNLTKLNGISLDLVDMSRITPRSFLNLTSSLKSLSLLGCGLHGNLPDAILKPNLEQLELSSNQAIQGSFLLSQTNWSATLRFLRLSETGFSGKLPSSIGHLSSLNVLDLSFCKFTGSLPPSLGNLTGITSLDLSRNSFTGRLPSSLANLISLKILSLEVNTFGGVIPDVFSNLTKMTSLLLSMNSFIGQLPSSLANLESLTELSLHENKFSGPIPDVFSNLQALTTMELFSNNFSGWIPSSVFNLTQLTHLDISLNQLFGPLPEQVSGLSILEELNLSDNLLDGAVPTWLFTLPSLLSLTLSENRLTGQIHEFKSGSSMNEMHLSRNNIHGPIPNSISGLVNITLIDLSWNNLSGVLNIDMISKLKYLDTLDLSGNSLSSIRSKHVTEWSMGYLNVSHNLLSRMNLPPLTKLWTLDLRSNFIHGSLPVLFHIELYLFLASNKFTGEIPPSVCNFTYLEILDLSNNSLSGRLPRCLGSFSPTLSVLNLRMNSFHGPIPGNFSRGNSLRNLDLNSNLFRGPLPRSLIHCQSLEVLDLANNSISDGFPFWLESLPKLQVLVLRSNQLHGPIGNPMYKNPFGKLRILDLSNNAFNGTLPTGYLENLKAMMKAADEENVTIMYMGEQNYQYSVVLTIKGREIELARILTIFSTVDLSSNRFEGHIPETFGNFTFLKLLNLSHNFLSGHIPSSLGNMAALESLDLSSNMLVGEIPFQLTALNFLAILNLSQNLLEGPIPRGQQFDVFNNDSYIGNLKLCGLPLSKKCGDEKAPQLSQSTLPEKDDSGGGFNWKIAAILAYGCGLVLGCSMAYVVFSTGKPRWFVKRVGEWQYKVRSLTAQRRRRKNL